jgi:hypothetical protein
MLIARRRGDRIELLFPGCISTRLALTSRFLRAFFQFGKRTASEAPEFSRSRIELLSVIGAARFECGEPAAEAGELIRRQLRNSFGDFFDFHVVQYSTAEAWVSDVKGLGACPDARLLGERSAYSGVVAMPRMTRGE